MCSPTMQCRPDKLGSIFVCSHLWVIAMKLADNAATPSMSFTNNATFVFSSGDVRVNEPYVTLEIRASRYDAARDYVLGDNSSFSMFNDQPQRYINGPLEEGTTYTVFVWAFLQRPMVRGVVGDKGCS